MTLAKLFTETQLVEFFGSKPKLDDSLDEIEFFGTRTFLWENGSLVFELSLDPYTPNVTLQLFESKKAMLSVTFEVSGGQIDIDGETKTLKLKAHQGFSILIGLPHFRLEVTEAKRLPA